VDCVEATDLYTLLLAQDIYGDTAVHSAAYEGNLDALKSLLDKLSPEQCLEVLNIKNNQQFTPLIATKSNKQYEAAGCIAEYKRKAENYFKGEYQLTINAGETLCFIFKHINVKHKVSSAFIVNCYSPSK